MSGRAFGVFFAWLACALTAIAAPSAEPRRIVGIYDAAPKDGFEASYLYEMAEFPLNHLGMELEYHNARQTLPDLSARTDVRGVLIWLIDANTVNGPALADFVERATARGLPVLVTGPLPTGAAGDGEMRAPHVRILSALGLRFDGGFRPYTYDLKVVHKDAQMVEFERKLPFPLAPLDIVQAQSPASVTPYLVLQRGGDASSRTLAAVTTPKGGYVAPGYASYEDRTADWKAWRVNPFALFREVFKTQSLPVADTTTLSGRRIYYSHIDGDGWNSVTEVDAYARQGVTAAEVILKEVAERFPDLPITVAPIAADLDTDWAGTPKSQDLARRFFRLPHIEAGTHTYTHPFEWNYFGSGYDPSSEVHFTGRYAKSKIAPAFTPNPKAPKPKLVFPYDVPRAYGDIPFDIGKEVAGSVAYISRFLPPGKQVRVLQWSGDTRAFPAAMDAVAQAGLVNINGRGSRFDGDYPSYRSVAPVGRRIGSHVQVYASHANENDYTALWQGRYFGFRYLTASLKNTETPRRVKPANVYYHMYSGEKPAALSALLEIMAHVRAQTLTPVTTSRYAAIGRGFFDVQFVKLGERRWRVDNRGALDTIRFDDDAQLSVDFAASPGVIGATRANGSLYVALDSANRAPILTLKSGDSLSSDRVTLQDSRWRVHSAEMSGGAFSFRAEGFGDGEMSWRAPPSWGPDVQLVWRDARNRQWTHTAKTGANGVVVFTIPSMSYNNIAARMTPMRAEAKAQ